MIEVLFFASLRERIDCASLSMEPGGLPLPVDTLIDNIAAQLGPESAELLRRENTVIAVNHRTVDAGALINDGDEVAFYPPVTGG